MSWEDEDDWENEASAPVPAVVAAVNPWEGEDEEDDAPDEWDAEPEPKVKKVVPVPNKPKKLSKKLMEERQKRIEEEARRRREAMTDAERVSEKMRQQKLVEDADHKLADELFGMGADSDVEDAPAPSRGIEDYKLEGQSDYLKFAGDVARRAMNTQNPIFVLDFLKETIKVASDVLTQDDMNSLKRSVDAIFNEKRKANSSKKKKGKKKKHVNVGRSSAAFDTYGADDMYADEYDFI